MLLIWDRHRLTSLRCWYLQLQTLQTLLQLDQTLGQALMV